MAQPLFSHRVSGLNGQMSVPGDKSISHRALMLGALAVGESRIYGLLEGEDVLNTAAAMRALGSEVVREEDGSWRLWGRGVGGLAEPETVLDMGNAGTGARLLMGLVASHPFTTFFTGDASLCSRPMKRVTDPLSLMGASFASRDGGRLPLAVMGCARPIPIEYHLPVASAQVKSAVLLAGLNAPGLTTVVEYQPTRDHTERMLRGFGAEVEVEETEDGGVRVSVRGYPELQGQTVVVPGDPSSAAFPLVAALLTPDSEVTLTGVGINPLRTGLFETLKDMGADLQLLNVREEAGEPIADLLVRSSALRGVEVPAVRAPSMIDEYPILAMAAACADGTTSLHGLGELRVKESDRFTAIMRGLEACGVRVEEGENDTILIHGTGKAPAGGVSIPVNLDHRIAMAFLVLGMVTDQPLAIDDAAAIATSFPGFVTLMNGLGAKITEQQEGWG